MGGCQSFIFTLCCSLGDVVYDIQYVENFFSSRRNNLVVEVLRGGGCYGGLSHYVSCCLGGSGNARFFKGHKLSARS